MTRSSSELAAKHPYQQLAESHPGASSKSRRSCRDPPACTAGVAAGAAGRSEALLNHQQAFGYTQEDINSSWSRWRRRRRPVGSMGTDTPIAVLSAKPKLLYNYFQALRSGHQPADQFERVEALVMSLVSMIGPRPNLLGHHTGNALPPGSGAAESLTNSDLEKVRAISSLVGNAFRTLYHRCHLDRLRRSAAGMASSGGADLPGGPPRQ